MSAWSFFSSSNALNTPVWGSQKFSGSTKNQRRSSIRSCSSLVEILCLARIYFWYAIRRFSLSGDPSTSCSGAASWTLYSLVSCSGSLNVKLSFRSVRHGCPWAVYAASPISSRCTGSGSLNLNNPLCSSGTISPGAAPSDSNLLALYLG